MLFDQMRPSFRFLGKNSSKNILEGVFVFLAGFGIADIIWHRVAFFATCSGLCMEPTICDGDMIFAYRVDPFKVKVSS